MYGAEKLQKAVLQRQDGKPLITVCVMYNDDELNS